MELKLRVKFVCVLSLKVGLWNNSYVKLSLGGIYYWWFFLRFWLIYLWVGCLICWIDMMWFLNYVKMVLLLIEWLFMLFFVGLKLFCWNLSLLIFNLMVSLFFLLLWNLMEVGLMVCEWFLLIRWFRVSWNVLKSLE